MWSSEDKRRFQRDGLGFLVGGLWYSLVVWEPSGFEHMQTLSDITGPYPGWVLAAVGLFEVIRFAITFGQAWRVL